MPSENFRESSFKCPLCDGFILVGKHSIKPDIKRAKEERAKAIEAAAAKLFRDWIMHNGGISENVEALRKLIEENK